uniref:Golgi integral membrane protein 4 n=1 Tax=Latimeria chalumnae TaxID=7897 RepID=H3B0S1_LATCH
LLVVYEHRSRLEKSLQKERLEHKKAKEDFLVYKLEAQETLNKGRQDSNNRYSSLTMQHQMLKSQHEELKKQYGDLQENHQKLGEDFNKDLDQHKQRYLQLQQSKEQELSRMKESIYNLREENRQLRKAHQDVHVQLQDVKQQHKNLLSQHQQLALTLEDHKSALAAAQAQVEEYKQLKETLIKMPSLRQSEQNVPLEHQDHLPEEGRRVLRSDLQQQRGDQHDENPNVGGDEPGAPKEAEANGRNFGERDFRGGKAEKNDHSMRLVEEENRRELEEEEMEQAGQPERLEEEEQEEEEGQQQQRDGHQHLQKEDANLVEKHRYVEEHPPTQPAARHKSAYEEQLEQQRLAAQRAEEARQVRARQEALRFQKLKEHLSRQQQIRERELELQREAERKEQLFQQERARQQAQYNIDQDIVEGEEEQKEAHGGGGTEENPHDEEVEDAEPEVGRQAYPAQHENVEREHLQKEDVNPADDPNNQGEDEFEEGEQDPEDHIPEERNRQPHDHPGAEEHLVMAGNPDQQEDNVDEYQEDGEEEAQEDLAEDKKVDEENVDGPYDNEGKVRLAVVTVFSSFGGGESP